MDEQEIEREMKRRIVKKQEAELLNHYHAKLKHATNHILK